LFTKTSGAAGVGAKHYSNTGGHLEGRHYYSSIVRSRLQVLHTGSIATHVVAMSLVCWLVGKNHKKVILVSSTLTLRRCNGG